MLPQADRILYLEDREVKFLGSYQELASTDLNLSKILNSTNEAGKEHPQTSVQAKEP